MRLAGCQLWAEALLMLSTGSVCHENIQAVCLNSLLWASVRAQSWQRDGERGPWSNGRKCHLGGDTGMTPDAVFWSGWSVYAMQGKESCCSDFIQVLCLRKGEMTVLCHSQLSQCKQKRFISSFKNTTANHCGCGTNLGCQENRGTIYCLLCPGGSASLEKWFDGNS